MSLLYCVAAHAAGVHKQLTNYTNTTSHNVCKSQGIKTSGYYRLCIICVIKGLLG